MPRTVMWYTAIPGMYAYAITRIKANGIVEYVVVTDHQSPRRRHLDLFSAIRPGPLVLSLTLLAFDPADVSKVCTNKKLLGGILELRSKHSVMNRN